MQVEPAQRLGDVCPHCGDRAVGSALRLDPALLRCPGCLAIFRAPGGAEASATERVAAGEAVKSTSLSASAVPIPVEPPRSIEVVLRVEEGPDAGQTFRASGVELVIGRRTGDVPLADDEVSRHHAILQGRGGRCLVRDLSSTNGSFVDGLRVAEAFLTPGQRLTVGCTTIEVLEIDGSRSAG